MVRFYEGADGLKTGHTDAAKYCLAATAKKNDMRLIAIVLGEEDSKTRNSETMGLLDYGFNNYSMQIVKKKDEVVKKITLEKANKEEISIVPTVDLGVLTKKGEESKKYSYDIEVNTIKLPIKQGEIVGKIMVKDGKDIIEEGTLTVTETVTPLSFFTLFTSTVKDILSGNCSF